MPDPILRLRARTAGKDVIKGFRTRNYTLVDKGLLTIYGLTEQRFRRLAVPPQEQLVIHNRAKQTAESRTFRIDSSRPVQWPLDLSMKRIEENIDSTDVDMLELVLMYWQRVALLLEKARTYNDIDY